MCMTSSMRLFTDGNVVVFLRGARVALVGFAVGLVAVILVVDGLVLFVEARISKALHRPRSGVAVDGWKMANTQKLGQEQSGQVRHNFKTRKNSDMQRQQFVHANTLG